MAQALELRNRGIYRLDGDLVVYSEAALPEGIGILHTAQGWADADHIYAYVGDYDETEGDTPIKHAEPNAEIREPFAWVSEMIDTDLTAEYAK